MADFTNPNSAHHKLDQGLILVMICVLFMNKNRTPNYRSGSYPSLDMKLVEDEIAKIVRQNNTKRWYGIHSSECTNKNKKQHCWHLPPMLHLTHPHPWNPQHYQKITSESLSPATKLIITCLIRPWMWLAHILTHISCYHFC